MYHQYIYSCILKKMKKLNEWPGVIDYENRQWWKQTTISCTSSSTKATTKQALLKMIEFILFLLPSLLDPALYIYWNTGRWIFAYLITAYSCNDNIQLNKILKRNPLFREFHLPNYKGVLQSCTPNWMGKSHCQIGCKYVTLRWPRF